jgi:hypothetical protein
MQLILVVVLVVVLMLAWVAVVMEALSVACDGSVQVSAGCLEPE